MFDGGSEGSRRVLSSIAVLTVGGGEVVMRKKRTPIGRRAALGPPQALVLISGLSPPARATSLVLILALTSAHNRPLTRSRAHILARGPHATERFHHDSLICRPLVNGAEQSLVIVLLKCCGVSATLRHRTGDDGLYAPTPLAPRSESSSLTSRPWQYPSCRHTNPRRRPRLTFPTGMRLPP